MALPGTLKEFLSMQFPSFLPSQLLQLRVTLAFGVRGDQRPFSTRV